MTRLYTRRELAEFVAFMLLPVAYLLLAVGIAVTVASWVTR